MMPIVELLRNGFSVPIDRLTHDIATFWQYKERLTVIDGLVILGDRVMNP